MKIEKETPIAAPPQDVFDYMLSAPFLDALVAGIDAISGIEEISRHEQGGVTTRTLRYEAPTASKIPGFLKKYQDRAPAHVHWEQRERWDTSSWSMSYQIVAEIKPEWQRYYDTTGAMTLSTDGAGALMRASLDFSVNVFGLKRLIERAARDEVDAILTTQASIIAAHFA